MQPSSQGTQLEPVRGCPSSPPSGSARAGMDPSESQCQAPQTLEDGAGGRLRGVGSGSSGFTQGLVGR